MPDSLWYTFIYKHRFSSGLCTNIRWCRALGGLMFSDSTSARQWLKEGNLNADWLLQDSVTRIVSCFIRAEAFSLLSSPMFMCIYWHLSLPVWTHHNTMDHCVSTLYIRQLEHTDKHVSQFPTLQRSLCTLLPGPVLYPECIGWWCSTELLPVWAAVQMSRASSPAPKLSDSLTEISSSAARARPPDALHPYWHTHKTHTFITHQAQWEILMFQASGVLKQYIFPALQQKQTVPQRDSHSVAELHLQQVGVVGLILALSTFCWNRIGWLRLQQHLNTHKHFL